MVLLCCTLLKDAEISLDFTKNVNNVNGMSGYAILGVKIRCFQL
jgi:hypothetical protein